MNSRIPATDNEFLANELLAIDRDIVWHPYGPMPASGQLLVDSARGVRLRLADGRQLVDGMSSWWAAIHGYRHPVLDAAAHAQIDAMSHVMFGGLTNEPAIRLAELLVEITPRPLQTVFFADSGSVSVEVAVKMAVQYWRSLGQPSRHRLLTWRGGYHGDTVTPMSVCDPDSGMHSLWTEVLTRQVFAPIPPTDYQADYAAELTGLVRAHSHELAAVIVEPVVQGAGGMRFPAPEYLRDLREVCDETSVLLIFDEIATGFGRTGELFAADHVGVSPDIMCIGKALTGGYVTLAATLCTRRIASAITAGYPGVLAHGPTFMANPLACAIALASTRLLLESSWRMRVSDISGQLASGLADCAHLPGVRDVRVLGAIGVIHLECDVDVRAATEAAVSAGVWLRPFRDLIYTMPPFITQPDDIDRICRAMRSATIAGCPG